MSKKTDDLAAEVARRGVEGAAKGTAEAIARAADGALDAVEALLFGKVGGAEEAVKREEEADPLDRLRAKYGAPKAPEAPRVNPVEEARAQLEELKRQRAAAPAPVKKTL